MFGHRVFLRMGDLPDVSIGGLLKNAYELLSCSYNFKQGTDADGKAQTEVYGGCFTITLPSLPSQELVKWMLRPGKMVDGSIVLCDSNNLPLSKIFFKNAACVNMEIVYMQKGNSYLSTQLLIQAEQIVYGAITFTNKWVNLK